MAKIKTITDLIEKLRKLESIEKTHNVHVRLMDEYRQEMVDLRLANSELRRANKFLKKATYALRHINRHLRFLYCYEAA